MNLDITEVTALLLALGAGPLLLALLKGIWGQITGRHDREATRIQRIIDARNKAENDRDVEAQRRRSVEEENHKLRLLISAHGGGHLLGPITDTPTNDTKEEENDLDR